MPARKSPKPSLSAPVYSLAGRSLGSMVLPKEIFGAEVNQVLLSQALRVYLNNQKGHHAHTKGRSEVSYSTAKVWRQKGTGRARHGAKSASIFVGGGIALGPKSRKVVLDLPKKMKKKALVSALSQKAQERQLMVLSGLEKATGKTKEMTRLLNRLSSILNRQSKETNSEQQKNKTILVVGESKMENAARALRNIPKVDFFAPGMVNSLEVIKHQCLILTKEAIKNLESRILEKTK